MFALPSIDPEFKGLIPPLQEDERMQLEQNILSAQKCHDAIVLWNGIILDGHNRFEICEKHGIEFQVIDMHFPSRDAAKVWILENQLNRRNLSDIARIEIALLKAQILREKAKKNQSHAGGDKSGTKSDEALLSTVSKPEIETVHVRKSLATQARVGEATLHRYMQVKEHGSPNLLEHMQSGRLKITTAHRVLEVRKQLKRANKMYKFITGVVPAKAGHESNQEIHVKLMQLSATLNQLLSQFHSGKPEEGVTNDPA